MMPASRSLHKYIVSLPARLAQCRRINDLYEAVDRCHIDMWNTYIVWISRDAGLTVLGRLNRIWQPSIARDNAQCLQIDSSVGAHNNIAQGRLDTVRSPIVGESKSNFLSGERSEYSGGEAI